MKYRQVWIFLVLLMLAATSTSATCIPAKNFANFNTIESPGSYYYIHFGDVTVTNSDFIGRFWESGNRAGKNEGTYDDADWLRESYYYPGTDSWYLNGNLGDEGVMGCPVISLPRAL